MRLILTLPVSNSDLFYYLILEKSGSCFPHILMYLEYVRTGEIMDTAEGLGPAVTVQQFSYLQCKKTWPILCSKLLYKTDWDFFDLEYVPAFMYQISCLFTFMVCKILIREEF